MALVKGLLVSQSVKDAKLIFFCKYDKNYQSFLRISGNFINFAYNLKYINGNDNHAVEHSIFKIWIH